jgi:hypothetical protein
MDDCRRAKLSRHAAVAEVTNYVPSFWEASTMADRLFSARWQARRFGLLETRKLTDPRWLAGRLLLCSTSSSCAAEYSYFSSMRLV